jgi:GntR family transcriptional regulator, transcriptional repressor for pyruvate dehydrogenase complex
MTEPHASTRSRSTGTGSQTDVVVQRIKAMIVDGELEPGSRLPVEHDLAAALGVSRGSLREGVRALAMMGVLETRQGDGTYVTSLDPSVLLAPMGFVVDLAPGHRTKDIAAVRRVLEAEAAARAATRITPDQLAEAESVLAAVEGISEDPGRGDHERMLEADISFHQLVARAAGNTVLEALIEGLSSRTLRTRLWRSYSQQGVTAATHRQHLDILRALAAGDPDRARIAMSMHLWGVEDFAAEHPLPTPDGGAGVEPATDRDVDPTPDPTPDPDAGSALPQS